MYGLLSEAGGLLSLPRSAITGDQQRLQPEQRNQGIGLVVYAASLT